MKIRTVVLFGLVFVAGLMVPSATARAVPENVLTPHSVAKLRQVGEVAISPDGSLIAYTLSVPRTPGKDEDGGAWSELFVIASQGGQPRPFVTGRTDVGDIAWTPDGKGVSFLSKRGDDKQKSLYVIPVDGGEARRAVAFGSDLASYSWSPDGKQVAFIASEPESKEAKKLKEDGFKQEIYEEDFKARRVYLAEAFSKDGEPRALDLDGAAYQVRWSPVDDRLAVALAPRPLTDDSYMLKRVRVVDSKTGKTLAKIDNPGKLGDVEWSPDGKRLAMISGMDLNDPAEGRLMVAPADGGALTDILNNHPGHVGSLAWQSPEALLFVNEEGVWTTFEKVGVDGSGRKRLVEPGGPILGSLSLSEDGMHAAFVGASPSHPNELFTMSHGESAPRRLTDSNPWLAEVRLAPQEVVRFKARDGLDLEGILIRPLEETPGRRYPLVLYVHGGPEAHHSNGWLTGYSQPGQVAAARGMAVFHTNYRGSTGRGVEFSKLSQGDPAGKEFDDLVDAVDHLVATGLADRAKVGVTGGSYGGYATGWCSTYYSDRFAVGVMFVGISDKISKVGTTDIPDEELLVHARMRPWDNWQKFLERSPIYYADRGRTPLLILHGKDDPRVNVGQSRELYRHLKLRGKAPVRLVLYPGEQHGNRKAAARLDYNLRAMRWLEHYLKGPGGDPPDWRIDYEIATTAAGEPD